MTPAQHKNNFNDRLRNDSSVLPAVYIFISAILLGVFLTLMGCHPAPQYPVIELELTDLCTPDRGWDVGPERWSTGQAFNTTNTECI